MTFDHLTGSTEDSATANELHNDRLRQVPFHALSFCWNHEGLGHASRLTAVHHALGAKGWKSTFLVEHPQPLLSDVGLQQVVIPSYGGCLRGDDWWGGGGEARMCSAVVRAAFESRPDLVIHDVVVHDAVYRAAVDLGVRQVYVARPRNDVSDIAKWILEFAPAIDTIFVIGQPEMRDIRGGVIVRGVDDIIRRPVGPRPVLWGDEPSPRFVLSTGGGGHAGTGKILSTCLSALAEVTADLPLSSVLVIPGPYFTESLIVPSFSAEIVITPYVHADTDLYAKTDIFVGLGGYNTVQEVSAAGVPAVLVAADRAVDDQMNRLHVHFDGAPQVEIVALDKERIGDAIRRALRADAAIPSIEKHLGADQIANYLDAQFHGIAMERPEYTIGEAVFLGRSFVVDSRVLVPRKKTEIIAIEACRVAKSLAAQGGGTVLEVGTGSGAIICSVAAECSSPNLEYVATDISPAALEVARQNADRHGVADKVHFYAADLLLGFDIEPNLVIANLPYLSHGTPLPPEVSGEPREAVVDDSIGEGLVIDLLNQLANRLMPRGTVLVEFDPDRIPWLERTGRQVLGPNTVSTRIHRDLANLARVVEFTWP